MSNEKFKVKFGLAVGDTAATIDGTTGNIITTGTIDVQGGTITESTGALTISTGASNASITLDPDGTGNVVLTFANGGNLTNNRNYLLGAVRDTTTLNNGNIYALQSTISPTRGVSLSNSDAPSSYRPGIMMRSYSGGAVAPRSWIVSENARGTVASPTAIQNNDKFCEIMAQGYNGTNWSGDQVLGTPFLFRASATEAWAASPARAGTKLEVICQPAGVTYTASTPMNIIDHSPTSAVYRADTFTIGQRTAAAGGTGQTMGSLFINSGKVEFAVTQARATSASNFATASWNTYRSTDGINYTPTQSGDVLGEFKFNGNANTSTTPGVPGSPGGNATVSATETWTSTANGTQMAFFTIKQGTLNSYPVFVANPNYSTFQADNFQFRSAAASPSTYATFDGQSATFNQPVGFPVKTAAQWNAITGAVGQQVSVSDSPTVGGRMAFWDTTNSRWSYVSDNSAV